MEQITTETKKQDQVESLLINDKPQYLKAPVNKQSTSNGSYMLKKVKTRTKSIPVLVPEELNGDEEPKRPESLSKLKTL
jgi:hypothetical protein